MYVEIWQNGRYKRTPSVRLVKAYGGVTEFAKEYNSKVAGRNGLHAVVMSRGWM